VNFVKKFAKGSNEMNFFWNSRGLGDLAKSRSLSDTFREQQLDFIALLKIGKKKLSWTSLNILELFYAGWGLAPLGAYAK
jgi:hypothetical protein